MHPQEPTPEHDDLTKIVADVVARYMPEGDVGQDGSPCAVQSWKWSATTTGDTTE